MTEQADWVDLQLVQWLLARTKQPGVVRLAMGYDVVERMERMTKPPSLMKAIGERWHDSLAAQVEQVPFVYAQPAPVETVPTFPTQQTAVQPQQAQPKIVAAPTGTSAKQQPVSQVRENLPVSTEKRPSSLITPSPTPKIPAPKSIPSATNRESSETAVPPTIPAPAQPSPKSQSTKPSLTAKQVAPEPQAAAQEQPMPVVIIKQPAVSSTASTSIPLAQTAPTVKPGTTEVNTLAPKTVSKSKTASTTLPSNHNYAVVIAAPTDPSTERPNMPIVTPTQTQSAPNKRLVKPIRPVADTKASTFPGASSRPLVQPRRIIPGTPPTFPSAVPVTQATNGQPKSPILADTPLPIARPSLVKAPTDTSTDLSLPKTAVTPPASATTSTIPGPGSTSGIIQRAPADESSTVTGGSTAEESTQSSFDISEIVAEVHRQFKRELAIEGERRGVSPWQ